MIEELDRIARVLLQLHCCPLIFRLGSAAVQMYAVGAVVMMQGRLQHSVVRAAPCRQLAATRCAVTRPDSRRGYSHSLDQTAGGGILTRN